MQSRIDVAGCTSLVSDCNRILLKLEDGRVRISASLDSKRWSDDLRIGCIQYLTVVIHNFKISVILTRDALLHYNWWDQHGYHDLTNDQKMENASRYWEGVVFAAFHGMYSIIESALRSLFLSFEPNSYKEATGKYWEVRKALNDRHVKFSDTFRELLFLSSVLRNCIHNGGVYRNKDKPSEKCGYKGKIYEFRDGLPPNCLHPPFFLDVLETASEGLIALMSDPKVLGLSMVEDAYARIGEYETTL